MDNDCRERVLEVTEVTAIPVGEIPPGTDAWHVRKTVPGHGTSGTYNAAFKTKDPVDDEEGATVDYRPRPAGTVTIGIRAAYDGGTLVPAVRMTGKARDGESDSVAGRLHKVTVSCEADDRDASAWDTLLSLERTPSHLMLSFRDGSRGFVWADRDTYSCTVERDGSKTSVSFRIEDDMGIQLIT